MKRLITSVVYIWILNLCNYSFVHAAILFTNGAWNGSSTFTTDVTTPNVDPVWIYDDFSISQDMTVTGLSFIYEIFDPANSGYQSTQWVIRQEIPGERIAHGNPLAMGSDVATINNVSGIYHELTVSIGSVNLPAGEYWLGTNNIMTQGTAERGAVDTRTDGLAGFIIDQNFTDYPQSGDTHFTIYGNVNMVPIPSAVWLFSSGLLGLVGVARR